MVKFIATKRASKSVTVDQFWSMKEKMKPREAEKLKKQIQVDLSDRYKFKSFRKEIKKIDVSLAHYIDEIKVQPYSQTEDNMGSFFLDELEQQNLICKTVYYRRFYSKVIDISQSLPLVLHNLDYILELILDNLALPVQQQISKHEKHHADLDEAEEEGEEEEEQEDLEDLDDAETLNKEMEPEEDAQVAIIRRRIMTPYMIKLLPELIRDCQHFVYKPFVDKIFLRITDLIDLNNLTLLQSIYKVLAYALKYFFPEITHFLGLYMSQLFLHRNKHVRQFSSESFSYIVKKMRSTDRKAMIPVIFSEIKAKCRSLRREGFEHPEENKYKVLQEGYLKESVSHMFFSCIVGMQQFMSHRGMDQFKEIIDVSFEIGRENEDVLEVLGMYLDSSFKHFTIEEQTDKLCFNLSDLLHALSLLVEKNVRADDSGFTLILQRLCQKIIDFLDWHEAANLNSTNVPHIASVLGIMIDYQYKHTDQLLKNSICGALGRLFKRGFRDHSSAIQTKEINEFLLEKLSVQETFEFFKLLIFPYEGKREAVNQAYTFEEGIYEYCLVLAFRHVDSLFDRTLTFAGEEDTQAILHNMFYMMTMIHEQSFPGRTLQLRQADELLSKALFSLDKLLGDYIELASRGKQNKSEATRCFRELLLFTKIAQFQDLANDELVNKYQRMITHINEYLNGKGKHLLGKQNDILEQKTLRERNEELGTNDFQEDSYIGSSDLYAFDESVVKKQELKSQTVNQTQPLCLLKSEMLVFVSSQCKEKTPELLVEEEISLLAKCIDNPNYLKNFAVFLSHSKRKLTITAHSVLFYSLCRNLRSKYTETRLASLQVLSLFEILHFLPTQVLSNNEMIPSTLKGPINMVEVLLKIQGKIPSIENERDIKMELARMKTNSYAYPPEYHYLLFNFCLGYLFVRFSLLWPITKEMLTHLCNQRKHPALPYIMLNLIAYYSYHLSPQFAEKYVKDEPLLEGNSEEDEEEEDKPRNSMEREAQETMDRIEMNAENVEEEDNSSDSQDQPKTFMQKEGRDTIERIEMEDKEDEQDGQEDDIPQTAMEREAMNTLDRMDQNEEVKESENDLNNVKTEEAKFFDRLFNDYYLFEGDAIEVRLVFENIFKAFNDVKRENIDAAQKSHLVVMLKTFFENEHKEIEFRLKLSDLMSELEIVSMQIDNQIIVNKHLYLKYTNFLQSFINFVSVRDIEKQHFYDIFLELLRKNKENIQALALECVLKFEKPALHKYQGSLKQMTKKENLRREMLNLNVNRDSKQIDDAHRSEVIQVIINILYPHLFTKKGSHNKSKKHSELQRNVIFEFFSSLTQDELGYLIDLVFHNFHLPDFPNDSVQLSLQKDLLQLHLNSISQFNTNIKNMMQKLGFLLKPFFNKIFNYLLCLFSSCQKLKVQIKQAKSNTLSLSDTESAKLTRIYKTVKKLQKQAIERYSEICRRYSNSLPGSSDFVGIFLTVMDDKMQQLRQDTVTSVPGVLKILSIWAEDPAFYSYFRQYEFIVPILVSLYNREKINVSIIQIVHKIFANLLGISSNQKQIQEAEEVDEDELQEDSEEDMDNENGIEVEEDEETLVRKEIILTVKPVTQTEKELREQFNSYMKLHFAALLKSMYSYLEFNLAPSALVKKNKQKKIDSLSLDIINHISSQTHSLDAELALNYINYFVKFLDAANIKKLKDIATSDAPSSEIQDVVPIKRSGKDITDKFTIFYKVLAICNSFLRLNKDNSQFYQQFVSILPFTQTEEFKKHAVTCIASLNLTFLHPSLIQVLQDMSIFERSMKLTLNYDKFIDAVFKVNTELMDEWIEGDLRCVETYFLMLMSSCADSEMSVRMAMYSSFQKLFELVGQKYDSISAENILVLKNFLFYRFLPFVAKELKKTKEEYVVKNILQLLKLYLQFIPTIHDATFFETTSFNYTELQVLIHTDENQDFLECITHIQMNRRIKGMNILMKTVESIKDQSSIWHIVLPVIEWTLLYKCQEIYKASNKMKLTDATLSHYKLLLQSAINTIGVVAKNLSIAKVKKILKKYVQFLSDKRFDQKITIKVLGSVLETLKLPYNVVEEVNAEMETLKEKKLEGTLLYDMIQRNKEFENPNHDLLEEDEENAKPEEELQPYDIILDEKMDVELSKEKWVENLEREKFFLKNQEQELDSLAHKDSEISSYYRFLRIQVFSPMKQLLFDQYSKAYNKHAKVSLKEKQKDKAGEKVRTFMTIGLIRLLIKFPKEIFRIEFPKIINKVVKNLRTKDNDERSFTRKVLLEIVRITGPYFFHYIVKELKFFLKEGWESHILNFTIFTLLTELDNNKVPIGSLDYCHSEIFPLLADEIFGKLNEEKNLQFSKIPEQKKNKANATFKILAKNLDFRNVISFLSFVRQQLVENLDGSKNLGKFEELFNFVLEGFVKNESVQHQELVTVSYSLIKDALEMIEAGKKKERLHDTTIAETSTKQKTKVHNLAKTYEINEVTAQNKSFFQFIQDSKKKNMFKIGCCLSNFGLKMCLMGIKKSVFAPEHILNQVEFEQLIKVVVECLRSTDNSMVISSLRILKNVIARKEAKGIRKPTISAVLSIMEKLTSTDIEMIGETFKLMNCIIENSGNSLKNSQYKALLVYLKQFMEVSEHCMEPLNVLKTIIEKKLIYEEVYDLVNTRVREMMIQSYAQNVNSICKQTFMSFLVKYPISDAIMQSSVNFLIKNTDYSYEQGRIIVYEILKTIIKTFPDKVLTFFGEIIFVSFLVNLIKEQNAEIRDLIKSSQLVLLQRLSKEQKLRLIENNLSWITQHNNPKIQVFLLFISLFQNLIINSKVDSLVYVSSLKTIKSYHLQKNPSQSLLLRKFLTLSKIKRNVIGEIFDSREERMSVFWEIIKQKRERKEALKNSEWKNIVEDETEERENEEELKNDALLNNVLDFVLAHNRSIKTKSLSNTLVFEGKKRLICSIIQFVNFPNQETSNISMSCIMELVETNHALAKTAFHDGIHVVVNLIPKLLKYLYFSKLKNNFIILNTSNTHKFFIFALKFFIQSDQETIAISLFENVLKIFLKSYIKAYYNKSQIENIVELILTLAKSMAADEEQELVNEVKEYLLKSERALEIILEILIKVKTNDQNNKISNHQTIENAELAVEELKKSINLNRFFSMYSKVKSAIESIKLERKQQQKQDFVTNPEAAFERKKDQNLKKRKAHQNKFKNNKKSHNLGKKILKKD